MKNPAFRTIQSLRDEIVSGMENPYMPDTQDALLENGLNKAMSTSAVRVLHPLFFKAWKEPRRKLSDVPVECVGMDVETDAINGEPKLLGFYYPDSDHYFYDDAPTLERFATITRNLRNNSKAQFCVWGRLDLQIVMRLFNPNEQERIQLSKGIAGKVTHGEIVVKPPCLRVLADETQFFIQHYIPGRALKLGWLEYTQEDKPIGRSVWIYNISQFYPGTIEQTAKGLGYEWITFDKETHIVDWHRYAADSAYHASVLESNKQDAKTVTLFSQRIQTDFAAVLDGAYPTQLISHGSLTDAAVASMTTDEDYNSMSWTWLRKHVWGNCKDAVLQAETLLSEAFSAGYVDQFAIGYFPECVTADISGAYPDKIRKLPDLRESRLVYGKDNLNTDIRLLAGFGCVVETAIIRGTVCIPDSLVYHPITIRNAIRQNYRPIGTFRAAYTLDERTYCQQYGATFQNEEYVIVGLTQKTISPLGAISEKLGKLRLELLAKMKQYDKDSNEYKTLDAQQYVVKVVDNSLYGKTVMTLEVVEEINGIPQIVGYSTGDRYNLLYGTLITARTRTQLAQAAMTITANGGQPIMCMTDSVIWKGTPEMLPSDFWRPTKVTGYFERPEVIEDVFLLKTGQYEYRKGTTFQHRLRGLPIPFEHRRKEQSYLRRTIQDATECVYGLVDGNPSITLETRRLHTIGQQDLDMLGAVEDGETVLRPFSLSGKSGDFQYNWRDCIDGYVLIPPIQASPLQGVPYATMRAHYERLMQLAYRQYNATRTAQKQRARERKQDYARTNGMVYTPRVGEMPWDIIRKLPRAIP